MRELRELVGANFLLKMQSKTALDTISIVEINSSKSQPFTPKTHQARAAVSPARGSFAVYRPSLARIVVKSSCVTTG